MSKKGYYITEKNPFKKIDLYPSEVINLNDMDLIELVLPDCKRIFCLGNKLTKLSIPKGCEEVYCANNKLTKLSLTYDCKAIDCRNNELSRLEIPIDALVVACSNNKLPLLIVKLFQSNNKFKIQLANNLLKN